MEPNIPLLDCPTDYLIGDASGKIMNEYGRFPCKIKCGVYAYMVRGCAKATLNITQMDFKQNDLLLIEPGTFLLIHEFSEDALVYYVLFSSSFLDKYSYSARISTQALHLSNPTIHMTDEVANVISQTFKVLLDALNCTPSLLSTEKMVHVFNMFQLFYVDFARQQQPHPIRPQDRKTEVYQDYQKLVLAHYHEWHHVAQYAEAMRLSLPHLCSTVKSVSGKTAGDLIIDVILTDAKAQLKITNLQIKEIAMSLGFDNVAFFNRFFKSHTGTTPKEYRKN